mmetsp:Transcript_19974/g.46658  ORF Transcript_19974/g.46658 Transcript_19974/m.46658 type:complete len:95 (-) Transcript_19974:385-669(-)
MTGGSSEDNCREFLKRKKLNSRTDKLVSISLNGPDRRDGFDSSSVMLRGLILARCIIAQPVFEFHSEYLYGLKVNNAGHPSSANESIHGIGSRK